MAVDVCYLDDEATLCTIFSEMLGSDEITITTFINADEAIEHCKTNPPDIFFIDYRLPETTGDQVASKVDDKIPKVLVTGDLSLNANYAFKHIIAKPYNFDEIKNIIGEYL